MIVAHSPSKRTDTLTGLLKLTMVPYGSSQGRDCKTFSFGTLTRAPIRILLGFIGFSISWRFASTWKIVLALVSFEMDRSCPILYPIKPAYLQGIEQSWSSRVVKLWLIISRRIPHSGFLGTQAERSVPLPHRSLI